MNRATREAPVGPTLLVDRIACDGHGLCAELVPELIHLDDWGYPILRPGPMPHYMVPLVDRAIENCPVLALRRTASTRPGRA